MVQISLKKMGSLAGLLILVLLVGAFLVLFTDIGRHDHAANVRGQPDPLDVAEFDRLSPNRRGLALDSVRRVELRAVCKEVAIAYSNEQSEVLCEWRRKLPGMLEPLKEDDLGDVWRPIIGVAEDELHVKLNRILGNEPIDENYVDVADFKCHVDALIAFSLLYGDIMLRRRDFGVPFKIHEASVFCRLKSYRDSFRAEGLTDLEEAAERSLARWIDQIESENGYTRALLVKEIAWLRVQGERIMSDSGKSWEDVSQDHVRGTLHTLTWAGYTPKWLDEFKNIPRHATPKEGQLKK